MMESAWIWIWIWNSTQDKDQPAASGYWTLVNLEVHSLCARIQNAHLKFRSINNLDFSGWWYSMLHTEFQNIPHHYRMDQDMNRSRDSWQNCMPWNVERPWMPDIQKPQKLVYWRHRPCCRGTNCHGCTQLIGIWTGLNTFKLPDT